ncbi:MAG: phosphotransferase [Prevotellaceae bacterium]|jgi:aminoglycoside/choline kinase family phosphotransferase|nr:phosphotransferase [Prevotellaceae bacterium]
MSTELKSLFQKYTGKPATDINELPSSGSNRRYFRLQNGSISLIGVMGTSVDENRAFYEMAKHFKAQKINVPDVYMHSADWIYYIQEDLGDTLLFNVIQKGRLTRAFDHDEKKILCKTIQMLPLIQFRGADGLNFNLCFPQPEFNERSILWDLNYFKYCFLKSTGIDFQENLLEDDFKAMTKVLLRGKTYTFMYRDFQSRNVMIKDDEPYFIDFQGGRKGPFYYDVASFLWQAKANFTDELRKQLTGDYIESLKQFTNVVEDDFHNQLQHFVLFRTLQVLGAYGFRGYFEKKPHFIQSVPFAIDNLRDLLNEGYNEYPYLCRILRRLTGLKQFSDDLKKHSLEVSIYSFAYKKGIPNDISGNGGGYVFDCRSINNPGKYEHYSQFNGLDEPVVKYLEDDGEILTFLETVYKMVDSSVNRYINRKFTNLMVCFGCTGGQHRSVYAAQHLAEHLNKKFGVKVNLVHREQNIEQTFEAKNQ